jgi:hypothetical protein
MADLCIIINSYYSKPFHLLLLEPLSKSNLCITKWPITQLVLLEQTQLLTCMFA